MKAVDYIRFSKSVNSKKYMLLTLCYFLRVLITLILVFAGYVLTQKFETAESTGVNAVSFVMCAVIFIVNAFLKFKIRCIILDLSGIEKFQKLKARSIVGILLIYFLRHFITETIILIWLFMSDKIKTQIYSKAETYDFFTDIFFIALALVAFIGVFIFAFYLKVILYASDYIYILNENCGLFLSLKESVLIMKDKTTEFFCVIILSFLRYLFSGRFFYTCGMFIYIAIMEYKNGAMKKWNEKTLKSKLKRVCCLKNI